MRLVVVGDIVGEPGRRAFARIAGRMRREGEVDFLVANAENAAGGRGLTPALAGELFDAGADVLTLGDHAWDRKELLGYFDTEPRILRPANYPPGCPGKGWITVPTPAGPVTVINLVGRVFMAPADCPFRAVDQILSTGGGLGRMIVVDLHAEATSEKVALGRYLNGRVSAVVGSHTHIQTADETILSRGTAYLTDLGMTGPKDSVIGRDGDAVLRKFLTGLPSVFTVADGDVRLEGVRLTLDPASGHALRIQRIQERIEG